MNNIRIDDTIVNEYINGNDVSVFRNDEVFSLGEDPSGQQINVYVDPNPYLIDKAKLITHGFIEEIKKLNFSNDPKIKKYIPNIESLESYITVKLVVGLPPGMRRMFRGNGDQGILIVVDVINGLDESDSNDLYIEDFANYIRYAVLLMLLDMKGAEKEENAISTLAHAIFTTSFAEYLSGTNQIEKLEGINLTQFWEYTEFNMIKKVLKKKKMNDVTAYMGMVVNSNPEMVVLGITGKRYLSCLENDDEIFEIYQNGDIEFIKRILKNKENKYAISDTSNFVFFNKSLIVVTMIYIGWSILGFIFGDKFFNQIFYIYPLIICIVWLLKDLYSYKINKNLKRFLINIGIIAVIAIAYMLIVL